jgi:hypothetical protein
MDNVDPMYCALNWRFGAYHFQVMRQPLTVRLKYNPHHARGAAARLRGDWRWFQMYDESED